MRKFSKAASIIFFSVIAAAAAAPSPPTPATPPSIPAPLIKPVVNREYLPTLLTMIGEAKKSIDFIQLEFHYDPTVKRIQDALRQSLKRGVKVRGLLEDNIDFNQTSAKYLNRFGIEARLDTPEKMLHNKLFIVDGEKVLLGSTNLSSNSMDNNNETNIYVENKRLGAFFENYFRQLWKNSLEEPQDSTLELSGLKTVINRQHFGEIFRLIQSARKKVWVLMYGMKYYDQYPDSKTNRLIDSLIEARKRGLEVKVVLDKSDYNQTLNDINNQTKRHLEAGGVPVRFDPEEITSHAKLVIADNRAIVGSANWGYSALEKRNESSLIISDQDTVNYFKDYFQSIWDEGK